MKVKMDPGKVCRYATAILLETAYVLIIAGLALLVAVIVQIVMR